MFVILFVTVPNYFDLFEYYVNDIFNYDETNLFDITNFDIFIFFLWISVYSILGVIMILNPNFDSIK